MHINKLTEGEADRADSTSVNSLMTIISHLFFQVHKQLPIIKDCCDSLWAAVYSSSQTCVFYTCIVLKSCVWHSFQQPEPNICQFILHFLMNLSFFLFHHQVVMPRLGHCWLSNGHGSFFQAQTMCLILYIIILLQTCLEF